MILVTIGGKSIVRLNPEEVSQEEFLQTYIKDNPEVIPLDDYKEEARLLILGREFPAHGGERIDVLAMDQDGELYVVETKLFKNADKRKVLAQMFDYGAALWDMPPEDFRRYLNHFSKSQFENKELAERVSEFIDDEEVDTEEIIGRLISHKEEGSITYIVLMDHIESRLKSLIRYVNANSKFDVLGVSLDFYRHDETEIIIPDVYGAEVRKDIQTKTVSRVGGTWSESKFFETAEVQGSGQVELHLMQQFLSWCEHHADFVKWGSGKVSGSFGPVFSNLASRTPFAIYTNGKIEYHFTSTADSDEIKHRFQSWTQALASSGFLTEEQALMKEPSVPLSTVGNRFEEFVQLVESHLELPS